MLQEAREAHQKIAATRGKQDFAEREHGVQGAVRHINGAVEKKRRALTAADHAKARAARPARPAAQWSAEDAALLHQLASSGGGRDWAAIAARLPPHTPERCCAHWASAFVPAFELHAEDPAPAAEGEEPPTSTSADDAAAIAECRAIIADLRPRWRDAVSFMAATDAAAAAGGWQFYHRAEGGEEPGWDAWAARHGVRLDGADEAAGEGAAAVAVAAAGDGGPTSSTGETAAAAAAGRGLDEQPPAPAPAPPPAPAPAPAPPPATPTPAAPSDQLPAEAGEGETSKWGSKGFKCKKCGKPKKQPGSKCPCEAGKKRAYVTKAPRKSLDGALEVPKATAEAASGAGAEAAPEAAFEAALEAEAASMAAAEADGGPSLRGTSISDLVSATP